MLRFSVITPSLNQGRFIEDSIKSVLLQNYPLFEHIIVDGESTDNTIEIIKKYPHLKWISEPDKGQSDALNKGLRIAKGDIICWLNSDDLLCENAFKIVNTFFNENLNKEIVIGDLLNIDENAKLLWRSEAFKVSLNGLLNGSQCVQQPSTFFRRQVFKIIGNFDEGYHYCMDHEFWVRVAKQFEFYTINMDLAMFRRYKGSKTINHELAFIKEIIHLKRKHNARILSYGNLRIFYSIIANPFKKIPILRKLIRMIKGKNPDYIYGGP